MIASLSTDQDQKPAIDGLDLSSDTGRLVLRIMLSLGEWELERVRSNWRTALDGKSKSRPSLSLAYS